MGLGIPGAKTVLELSPLLTHQEKLTRESEWSTLGCQHTIKIEIEA